MRGPQIPVLNGTEKLIFLDIDGVLNAHGYDSRAESNLIDRDKVMRLNEVLERSGAYVVVSSAWRYMVEPRREMTLEGLDWLLRSHGLMAGRLAGITRPDTMMRVDITSTECPQPEFKEVPLPKERSCQVLDWIEERGHTGRFIAIDDGGLEPENRMFCDMGFNAAGIMVVWTHPGRGLQGDDVEQACLLLLGD